MNPPVPLDCAKLSLSELARARIEHYSKSDRDRDDNLFAIMDFGRDLREQNPDRMTCSMMPVRVGVPPEIVEVTLGRAEQAMS